MPSESRETFAMQCATTIIAANIQRADHQPQHVNYMIRTVADEIMQWLLENADKGK